MLLASSARCSVSSAALAAWVLVHLIALITNAALFHEFSATPRSLATFDPGWPLFVVAIAGALLISLLAKWAPVIRGHGIPEAMEAVLTKQSRVAPRTAIAKPISAAIAIGTGAPFGAEGPIIVTGGSIGSLLGQVIPVTPSERKILLAAGAAPGCRPRSARRSQQSCSPSNCCCSSSRSAHSSHSSSQRPSPAGCTPPCSAADRSSRCRRNDYAGLGVLPAFALLGLACGVLAIVISRGLFFVEDLYRRLPISNFWYPAIGAIGFATVGLFVPRALGVGYDAIDDVLNARLAVGTVAALALGKLVAWWLALGSGTSGGTLAPDPAHQLVVRHRCRLRAQPRAARATGRTRRVRDRGDGGHVRRRHPGNVHGHRVRVRAHSRLRGDPAADARQRDRRSRVLRGQRGQPDDREASPPRPAHRSALRRRPVRQHPRRRHHDDRRRRRCPPTQRSATLVNDSPAAVMAPTRSSTDGRIIGIVSRGDLLRDSSPDDALLDRPHHSSGGHRPRRTTPRNRRSG